MARCDRTEIFGQQLVRVCSGQVVTEQGSKVDVANKKRVTVVLDRDPTDCCGYSYLQASVVREDRM